MFEIETKDLKISDELNRKIEMICRFACVNNYSFENGNIVNLRNTNIAYVKPHILKVKDNDYLIFENSEIDFNKEIKQLDKQMDRIKNAYIKGILKIDDFDKEIKHIDFKRNELLNKQKEQKQYESLSFTLDDLLILEDKQEIEIFTNPSNYLSSFYKWDSLDRQEKQKIIAKYIDNLTTLKTNNKINIINGEFRSSYLKDLIDNHDNYSVPFNLRLFKDEYGCYLNMNHEVKSKEEVKNYYDKLCSTLNEYKFNYYEIDTDDDLKDIKYSSNINLEKIIRLISIKPDKRFKNQNLKLGVITLDLSNIPNISNETYSKIFKDLKEKFKNELESQKT